MLSLQFFILGLHLLAVVELTWLTTQSLNCYLPFFSVSLSSLCALGWDFAYFSWSQMTANFWYSLHCFVPKTFWQLWIWPKIFIVCFFGTCKDDLKSSSSAISSSIQSVSTPCMRRVRLGSRLPYTSLSSSTCTTWGVAQNTTSRVRHRFDPVPLSLSFFSEQQALLLFGVGKYSIPLLALLDSGQQALEALHFYHCLTNKIFSLIINNK